MKELMIECREGDNRGLGSPGLSRPPGTLPVDERDQLLSCLVVDQLLSNWLIRRFCAPPLFSVAGASQIWTSGSWTTLSIAMPTVSARQWVRHNSAIVTTLLSWRTLDVVDETDLPSIRGYEGSGGVRKHPSHTFRPLTAVRVSHWLTEVADDR